MYSEKDTNNPVGHTQGTSGTVRYTQVHDRNKSTTHTKNPVKVHKTKRAGECKRDAAGSLHPHPFRVRTQPTRAAWEKVGPSVQVLCQSHPLRCHQLVNRKRRADLDVRKRSLGIPSRDRQPVARAFCVQFVSAVWQCVRLRCRRARVCSWYSLQIYVRKRCFRALVAVSYLSLECCTGAVHVYACSRCSQLRVVRVRCFSWRAVD